MNITTDKEIWKDVEEFMGSYQVSSLGRVRSLDRFVIQNNGVKYPVKGRIMKLTSDKYGYLRLSLRKKGKRHMRTLHRLVAEAFIGKCPPGKVVNHIDENKQNNNVNNLEYITVEENNNHGTRNERISKTKINGKKSKAVTGKNLQTGQVISFPSAREAERKSNGYFHQGSISHVCLGNRKQHKGYTWEYQE